MNKASKFRNFVVKVRVVRELKQNARNELYIKDQIKMNKFISNRKNRLLSQAYTSLFINKCQQNMIK